MRKKIVTWLTHVLLQTKQVLWIKNHWNQFFFVEKQILKASYLPTKEHWMAPTDFPKLVSNSIPLSQILIWKATYPIMCLYSSFLCICSPPFLIFFDFYFIFIFFFPLFSSFYFIVLPPSFFKCIKAAFHKRGFFAWILFIIAINLTRYQSFKEQMNLRLNMS